MTTRIKLETKGFEEYLERIAQAGQDVDVAAAQALQAGAEILMDGMKRRVPKDTYNLDQHIRIKGPEQDGNYHSVEVGVIHDIAYTDADTARYGNVMEHGSSSTAAQPYVRPTLDTDMGRARKAMRAIFEKFGLVK